MDDAGAVRLVERRCNLARVVQRLFEREPAADQPRGERLALEMLHDEKIGLAIAADVVQRADVRVTQRRDRPRLTLEAFAPVRIGRYPRRQDLDRDGSIQTSVACLVHLPHSAYADGREDLVRTQPRACAELQRVLSRTEPGFGERRRA